MMILLVTPSAWGMRNASPFSLKAEALMRRSGLEFTVKRALPNKGPRKKLPALVDGDHTIPDSELIREHLETQHDVRFDPDLSLAQHGEGRAFQRMFDEHFYFVNLHLRWIEEAALTRDGLLGDVPKPIRGLVYGSLQRGVKRALYMQGTGRFSQEEIHRKGIADLEAFSHRLGERPFLFGDGLSTYDVAVYAQLYSLLKAPHRNPVRRHAESDSRLTQFVDRCDQELFETVG